MVHGGPGGLIDNDIEQVRRRLVASNTTLLGLLKHLTFVENVWFNEAITGTSTDNGTSSAKTSDRPTKPCRSNSTTTTPSHRSANATATSAQRHANACGRSNFDDLITDRDAAQPPYVSFTSSASPNTPTTPATPTSSASNFSNANEQPISRNAESSPSRVPCCLKGATHRARGQRRRNRIVRNERASARPAKRAAAAHQAGAGRAADVGPRRR